MANQYVYNDLKLPALPVWDKNVYTYATIFMRADEVPVLVLTDVPFKLVEDSEGAIKYAIQGTYNNGYYELLDSGAWSSFYFPLDTMVGDFTMRWTDHDVIDVDGTVFMFASEPELAKTYIYNGVELQVLPEWDMNKLPYCVIMYDSNSDTYRLHCCDKELKKIGTKFCRESDAGNIHFTEGYSTLTRSDTFYNNPKFNQISSASYLFLTNNDYMRAVWSNFDIYNSDGTLLLGASKPINPANNNAVDLYNLRTVERTLALHPKSFLHGIMVGRKIKTQINTELNISNKEDDSVNGDVHSGIIPSGGTYYIGVTSTKVNDYTGATTTLSAGDSFPDVVSDGDVYVYGDYEYRYNYYGAKQFIGSSIKWTANDKQQGWGVSVLSKTKTSYGNILSAINDATVNTAQAAFMGCSSLVTAPQVPNTIFDLSYAFYGCSALEAVPALPSSIANLSYAFYNCSSLSDPPSIPYGITSLYYTFYGCKKLSALPCMPIGLKHLSQTFYGCTSLTEVDNIPCTVESLYYTFANCTSLTHVKSFPVCTKNLNYTFSRCSALTDVAAIPANVISMDNTFYQCTSLVNAPDMKKVNNLSVMYETFYNCTALTKAPDIPACIRSLSYTFAYCTSLVNMPNMNSAANLVSMDSTFDHCSALKNISSIPSSVKYMYYTFSYCTSLSTFPSLPQNITHITGAFRGTGIVSISGFVIPQTVISMSSLFSYCKALTFVNELTIPEHIDDISYLFKACSSLSSITGFVVPKSVVTISGAFSDCAKLTGTIQIQSEKVIDLYAACFENTTLPIVLTGTGSAANIAALNKLALSANNGNVTVN